MLRVTLGWTSIPSRRGTGLLLVASCHGTRNKHQPDGPLDLNADFLPHSKNAVAGLSNA